MPLTANCFSPKTKSQRIAINIVLFASKRNIHPARKMMTMKLPENHN